MKETAIGDAWLNAVMDSVDRGKNLGILQNKLYDEPISGRFVRLQDGGPEMLNLGSCSYLGLELDPRIRNAVVRAVMRYGVQFSSSRAFAQTPGYDKAESLLGEIFGRPVLVTPSTTLGHLSAMPTLIGKEDLLILDQQVHHSVQLASKLVGDDGFRVQVIPHDDLRVLEKRIEEQGPGKRRIWYAADGLYSMFGDFFPAAELNELAERHENLWLYIDDAHAVSWSGRNGRGAALQQLSPAVLERTVVAASLNKCFAASGGAICFPDKEALAMVRNAGAPMLFSGPVPPPMLGAIVASAEVHLSEELSSRQEMLRHRIRLFNRLSIEAGLPLVSVSVSPIRFIGTGPSEVAFDLVARLRRMRVYALPATFPAVPANRSGTRITITNHLTEEDIVRVVETLAVALPQSIRCQGSSMEVIRKAFWRHLRNRSLIGDGSS
jgi:7-keto-8-aminopelargonate synthetase-like enzyme